MWHRSVLRDCVFQREVTSTLLSYIPVFFYSFLFFITFTLIVEKTPEEDDILRPLAFKMEKCNFVETEVLIYFEH